MKHSFSQHIFEKCLNNKFHEIATSGKRDVPLRQTGGRRDRHYKANSLFRNFANAPKMTWPNFGRSIEAVRNMEGQSKKHLVYMYGIKVLVGRTVHSIKMKLFTAELLF